MLYYKNTYDLDKSPPKRMSRKSFQEHYGRPFCFKEFKIKFEHAHVTDDPYCSDVAGKTEPLVEGSFEDLIIAEYDAGQEI